MKIKEEETTEEKLLYRKPMKIREIIVHKEHDAFPVCPKCSTSLEREFQSFCDRCGQKLDWKGFTKAKIRYI